MGIRIRLTVKSSPFWHFARILPFGPEGSRPLFRHGGSWGLQNGTVLGSILGVILGSSIRGEATDMALRGGPDLGQGCLSPGVPIWKVCAAIGGTGPEISLLGPKSRKANVRFSDTNPKQIGSRARAKVYIQRSLFGTMYREPEVRLGCHQ